jgi:hypothetical protein
LGSDSQSGVRMGEEKMARSSVEDDQLDQRKFLKESRTLMVGGLSVEKSLLNSFGVEKLLRRVERMTHLLVKIWPRCRGPGSSVNLILTR